MTTNRGYARTIYSRDSYEDGSNSNKLDFRVEETSKSRPEDLELSLKIGTDRTSSTEIQRRKEEENKSRRGREREDFKSNKDEDSRQGELVVDRATHLRLDQKGIL